MQFQEEMYEHHKHSGLTNTFNHWVQLFSSFVVKNEYRVVLHHENMPI